MAFNISFPAKTVASRHHSYSYIEIEVECDSVSDVLDAIPNKDLPIEVLDGLLQAHGTEALLNWIQNERESELEKWVNENFNA